MAKAEPLLPEALEKIEIPIIIGIGLDFSNEPFIQFLSHVQKMFLEEYPTFKWELILYNGPIHLIESVKRVCPQILIVSSYWGHLWPAGASTHISNFLYETMEDRKKNESLKPFIALVQGRSYGIPKQYQQNIHYDIFLSESNFNINNIPFHPEGFKRFINTLIQLLPDRAFVPNS